MSAVQTLGLVQILVAIPKAWMAVRQPRRRVWHVVSGLAIVAMGFVMLLGSRP